jgi:hypothetical protein
MGMTVEAKLLSWQTTAKHPAAEYVARLEGNRALLLHVLGDIIVPTLEAENSQKLNHTGMIMVKKDLDFLPRYPVSGLNYPRDIAFFWHKSGNGECDIRCDRFGDFLISHISFGSPEITLYGGAELRDSAGPAVTTGKIVRTPAEYYDGITELFNHPDSTKSRFPEMRIFNYWTRFNLTDFRRVNHLPAG